MSDYPIAKIKDNITETHAYEMSEMDAYIDSIIPAWQPIETAPKDGTSILGVDVHNGGVVWHLYWSKKQHGWQRWNSEGQDVLFLTHWQPLPEPPKEVEGE